MRRSSRSNVLWAGTALGALSLAIAASGWAIRAEAAPPQRDPWSQPASDRPGWSDAAPAWTDPSGDQAQQGRTWANPRRGRGEPSDAAPGTAVGGQEKSPAPGEPNWDEKRSAPPKPRERAEDRPTGPQRRRAGEPSESERPPSRPHQAEDARPRPGDEATPAPRRRLATVPSVQSPPAHRLAARRDIPRGFDESPGPAAMPMRYPVGFAGGEPPFLPYSPLPRCPLIIKVGRGLANPVRSEIIGGRRNCL